MVFVGTSGSGKTTLARQVARRLGLPHVELDAIRHQANWVEMPDDLFRQRVADIVAGDEWVIDGNYGIVRDLTFGRATQVVWLDLPRSTVMRQVIWRSFCRAALGQELWNGNREPFTAWLRADHPIRWAWSTHARRRAEFEAQFGAHWYRLRSRREAQQWLATLPRPGVTPTLLGDADGDR
jgi:adenylate kinase family enzyme